MLWLAQSSRQGKRGAPACTVLTHHFPTVHPLSSVSGVWYKSQAMPGLPATQNWAQVAEPAESRPKRRAGLQGQPRRALSTVCPGTHTTPHKAKAHAVAFFNEKKKESNLSVSHKPTCDQRQCSLSHKPSFPHYCLDAMHLSFTAPPSSKERHK